MVRVTKPGLLTTVQDAGRYGVQQYGVPINGAMDQLALRLANLLLANDPGSAVLEITLQGPELVFTDETILVLTGADLSPSLNRKALPLYQPVLAKAGATLRFGSPRWGCRAYLAVAGGWDLPLAMGSRSTNLQAGIGGLQGRALQRGDQLAVCPRQSPLPVPKLKSSFQLELLQKLVASYRLDKPVRALEGPQWNWFTLESLLAFFGRSFRISAQSNRMGYRLEGQKIVTSKPRNLLSEAVTCGSVQVLPEGNPIVLLADCQTVGGYPKIAQVISTDLPTMAQLTPGGPINFQLVSLSQAEQELLEREQQLAELHELVSKEGVSYVKH